MTSGRLMNLKDSCKVKCKARLTEGWWLTMIDLRSSRATWTDASRPALSIGCCRADPDVPGSPVIYRNCPCYCKNAVSGGCTGAFDCDNCNP